MQCLSRETAGNNGARATFCSSGRDLGPKALIVLNAHWAIGHPPMVSPKFKLSWKFE